MAQLIRLGKSFKPIKLISWPRVDERSNSWREEEKKEKEESIVVGKGCDQD